MAKLAEIWPAAGTLNGGTRQMVRAVVYRTDRDMLAVWIASNRKAVLLTHAEVASWDQGPPHVLETVEGDVWEIRPGGGCGCGSPLRGLNWRGALPQEVSA